jgi:chromosome segregation ATPase
VAAAQPLPLVEEDKGKAAATGEERDQGANAGQHPGRGSGRRAAEAASVDETALVRGFVERFERLLAEIDELKRRAQSAEERVATTEKLLRSAERRAETAETRLAEAQERLRTWAELTRRMQQLSRQADGGSRGRAGSSTKPAARDGTAARGQAESGPA